MEFNKKALVWIFKKELVAGGTSILVSTVLTKKHTYRVLVRDSKAPQSIRQEERLK